jgi:hypothetical protein
LHKWPKNISAHSAQPSWDNWGQIKYRRSHKILTLYKYAGGFLASLNLLPLC